MMKTTNTGCDAWRCNDDARDTDGLHYDSLEDAMLAEDPFQDTYPSDTWCGRARVDAHTDVTCQMSLVEAGTIAAEFEANG